MAQSDAQRAAVKAHQAAIGRLIANHAGEFEEIRAEERAKLGLNEASSKRAKTEARIAKMEAKLNELRKELAPEE